MKVTTGTRLQKCGLSRSGLATFVLLCFGTLSAQTQVVTDVGAIGKTLRRGGMSTVRDHSSRTQLAKSVTKQTTTENIALFTFVALDVPGAAGTLASDINSRGEIVGAYFDTNPSIDPNARSHGFLLKGGRFTTIDVPGSLVGVPEVPSLWTEANGINSRGDIVGDYFAPPGAPGASACAAGTPELSPQCRRGFLYRNGEFSDVLVPGKKGSIANGITPDGTVYGCDHDDDYFLSMFGFARIRNSGEGDEGSENGDTSSQQSTAFSYITLNAGGGELVDPAQSVPASMNNGATPDGKIIVGLYFDMTGQPHGYVVQDGTFRPYDVPGSTGTLTWEINPAADFVGYYFDGNGNQHGFLQRWGESVPITVDAPSEPPFNSILSNAFGINPQGAIAGLYIDSGAVWHGFIAVPGTSR